MIIDKKINSEHVPVPGEDRVSIFVDERGSLCSKSGDGNTRTYDSYESIRELEILENPLQIVTIKKLLRELFKENRRALGYGLLKAPSKANTIYIDPEKVSNGVGTFEDPLNTMTQSSGFAYSADTNYLIKESTKVWNPRRVIDVENVLIGTYDAATGERVISLDRLGIVDWNTGEASPLLPRKSGFVASGVIITCSDGERPGDRRGIYFTPLNLDSEISPVVEYCWFKGIDSRKPGGGTIPGGGVFSMVSGTTVRFCKFTDVYADQIWIGDLLREYQGSSYTIGGKNPNIYGNDIVIPADIEDDGPDGIQISGNEGPITLKVHDNWVENKGNVKQTFVAGSNGFVEKGFVARNFFIASDLSRPNSSSNEAKNVEYSFPNTIFLSNVLINGNFGINLTRKASSTKVVGNVFITTINNTYNVMNDIKKYTGISLDSGNVANPGVLNVKIFNNTLINLSENSNGIAISGFGELSHETSSIFNNLIFGNFLRGISKTTSLEEHHNTFYGPVKSVFNIINSSETLGEESFVSPFEIDIEFNAKNSEHLSEISFEEYFIDIYGNSPERLTGKRGAIQ